MSEWYDPSNKTKWSGYAAKRDSNETIGFSDLLSGEMTSWLNKKSSEGFTQFFYEKDR